MKKKVIWLIAAAVVLVLLAAAAMGKAAKEAALQAQYDASHIRIGNVDYPRDLAHLDLRGQSLPSPETLSGFDGLQTLDLRDTGLTIEQYTVLHRALPECQILWQLPFQGRYYPLDTREIQVSTLTQQDVEALDHLTGLQSVDAAGCTDYDALMALRQRRPQCDIRYSVTIGGIAMAGDITHLELDSQALPELEAMLPYLPELTSVTVTDEAPDHDALCALSQAWPQVQFCWNFTCFGVSVSSMTRELDLSGIPMQSTAQLEEQLPYFHQLEKVTLCGCGLASEDIDAMWQRNPQTRFVWDVQIGTARVRTDIQGYIPYKYGYSHVNGFSGGGLTDADCKEMKYLVDLVCLDLGHMEVTDLSFLYHMPKLEYLLLVDCPIRDFTPVGSLKELKYLECFLTGFCDASVLSGCEKLEDLNLCYTSIRDITPLLSMPQLQRLWLGENELTQEQMDLLTAALPDTKVVFYVYGDSTGMGWRQSPNYRAQRSILGMWIME